jgi:hypothetical protein
MILRWRLKLGAGLLAFSIVLLVARSGGSGQEELIATPPPLPACTAAPDLPATPQADRELYPFGSMITRESVWLLTNNLVACQNDRDWGALFRLVTPALLSQLVDTDDLDLARERFETLAAHGYLPLIDHVGISETEITHRRGVASTVVSWQEGNALKRQRWSFVGSDDGWRLDGVEQLDPAFTPPAAGIVIEILQGSMLAARAEIIDPGTIVLELFNKTGQAQTVEILEVPAGATPSDLISTIASRDAMPRLVGYLRLEPESVNQLPLVELEDGVYAITVNASDPWQPSTVAEEQLWMLTVTSQQRST